MDTFDLTNLVKDPTCFKNRENPTMLDLFLTNAPSLLCNTSVFNCSLSHCHSMIFTCIREQVKAYPKKSVSFRSYKNLDEHDFNKALNDAPFHVGMIFDDIDDNYWFYEKLFLDTLQEHAPVKQKRPRKEPPPYMNSNYRKLIYKTRQAHNKYMKNKSKENWEQFGCLRNLKTKVKRESIQTYFSERCGGGPKSKDFWPTIKPFLSSKSTNKSSNNIILKENDNLVSDQTHREKDRS